MLGQGTSDSSLKCQAQLGEGMNETRPEDSV
jgi:hypothetical protein